MNLHTRIDRLEGRIPPRCPHCRDWPATYATWGDGPASDPHPPECPVCGRQRRTYVLEPSSTDPAGWPAAREAYAAGEGDA